MKFTAFVLASVAAMEQSNLTLTTEEKAVSGDALHTKLRSNPQSPPRSISSSQSSPSTASSQSVPSIPSMRDVPIVQPLLMEALGIFVPMITSIMSSVSSQSPPPSTSSSQSSPSTSSSQSSPSTASSESVPSTPCLRDVPIVQPLLMEALGFFVPMITSIMSSVRSAAEPITSMSKSGCSDCDACYYPDGNSCLRGLSQEDCNYYSDTYGTKWCVN
ncbi:hypothetical protein H257_14174 [Aphanomyces astaci]|uniref:Uncharacterized protein n=1 Tax=Aphanomyces astaci TaxID=112090 RepID=W4FS19_APHAT|nr:hypothetical protein H257_14174 [Aphanomyces astaci]ETV70272.1 hypothetical protein H257_14174 [Aphanomyces astaci]|eukprot:XP_009840231.1 hypothetical protein H257_14174 [Aphanomyces astaci]